MAMFPEPAVRAEGVRQCTAGTPRRLPLATGDEEEEIRMGVSSHVKWNVLR